MVYVIDDGVVVEAYLLKASFFVSRNNFPYKWIWKHC